MNDARKLLAQLFPAGHAVAFEELFFSGTGTVGGEPVAVLGLTDGAAIGVELAHQMAGAVLRVVRDHPGRPILMLVDTSGQRLSRRDELLEINGYLAHLARSFEVARRAGHRIVGLVYSQAVSGGFLASGLFADACYALPDAEVRVMNLAAMARITKIPVERLEALSQSSPVFAPGVENYVRMGAIEGVWTGDLAACLAQALRAPSPSPASDVRRERGEARRGRLLARAVAERVRRD